MRRATWMGWALLMLACGGPEMLGETDADCKSESTQCDGKKVVYPNQSDKPAHAFELEAQERLPAAWTIPLAGEQGGAGSSGEVVDVEPGPHGDVWVLQLLERTRNLLRIDATGREVAAFAVPPSLPMDIEVARLTVSSTGQPVVDMVFGKDGMPRVHSGYVLRQEATPVALNQAITSMNPLSINAGPEDHLVVVTAPHDANLIVQELTRDGAPIWTTTVPYPKGFRRTQMVSWSHRDVKVVRAANGAMLLLWPAARVETPDIEAYFLTLIDVGGSVKWHTEIQEWTQFLHFAGVAPASYMLSTSDGTLSRIFTMSEEGELVDRWRADPVAYHGRQIDAITSDAAGNLYLGLTTGLRTSPQVTVCKINPSDASMAPKCVDLDLEPGLAQAKVDDITSPAANKVVVAYRTGPDATRLSWRVSGLSF